MKCPVVVCLVWLAGGLLGGRAWGASPRDSVLRRIDSLQAVRPALEVAINAVRMGFPSDSAMHREIEHLLINRYRRNRDSLWLGAAWMVAGQSAMQLSDLKASAAHFERAWGVFSRRNSRKEAAYAALQLASVQHLRQRSAEALVWIKRCVQNTQPDEVVPLAAVWAIEGNIHFNLKQHSRAIESFQKALWLLRDTKNPIAQINICSNLGAAYGMIQQLDSSVYYIERAYHLNAGQPMHLQIIEPIINLASIYLYDKPDPSRARQLLDEALALSERNPVLMGNRFGILMKLGEVYLQQGRTQEALRAYWQAWHAAQSSDRWDGLAELAPRLIRAHAQASASADSIDYYLERLKEAQDSLTARTHAQEVRELQARYEVSEKDHLIALQRARAERDRLLIVALIVLAVLKVVVLVLVVRSRRRQQRARQELIQQNRIIESQKEELAQQAEELRERNSELTLANHELAAANKRLLELDRFKNAVTGMIVHDLKNPLNAVLLLTNLLPPGEQSEAIRQAGQQMLNLTLNLLDVQKFEAGSLPLDRRVVAVADLVQQSTNQVRLLAQQKAIQWELSLSDDLHAELDADLIVRLLVNLLTNAIKYSPQGGTVEVGGGIASERNLRLWVCDQGPGVAPAEREVIFEPFVQGEARNSGLARSTGLGLAFCRAAAQAHGGCIWVEDRPDGEGSRFVVELPEAVVRVDGPITSADIRDARQQSARF